MNKRMSVGILAGLVAVSAVLTGCSSSDTASSTAPSTSAAATTSAKESASASASASSHATHDHALDGGAAPAGMVKAASPQFKVGEKVTLTADHAPGMEGASATVVGAYDTTVYEVDYTPIKGGEPVKNHKWVVQEELSAPQGKELKVGDKTTLKATHMEGMDGAEATIVAVKKETAYMVDYTAGGKTYTNHKWVTGEEMTPAK